jgi:hypothetical protein
MTTRLPLILSATALVVAVLGQAPIASAVRDAVLPKNSVGSAQLKQNAVTGAKVANGSLMRADFRPGQLPVGPKGDKGDRGDPGLIGFEVAQASTSFDSAPEKRISVECPAGKRLVGGGGGAWGRAMAWTPGHVALLVSQPVSDTLWYVAARELQPSDEEWYLQVRAYCAQIP